MRLSRFIMTFILSVMASVSMAAVTSWKISSPDSKISFTAIQNNAPVTGQFKTFSGDILFDPNQLSASHVTITVDLGSVISSYDEVSDTLKSADWFNVKVFPQAVFKSNSFTKTGDKTYQAIGTLTIRDKSQPVTLTFTLNDYTATKASIEGSTTIKRTQFGVGQGEWAKTDGVKDDVKVDFIINANAG